MAQKFQTPGSDTPLSKEDMIKESNEFKGIELYATWQTKEICHSGYQLKGSGMDIKKLRVLTFSVN